MFVFLISVLARWRKKTSSPIMRRKMVRTEISWVVEMEFPFPGRMAASTAQLMVAEDPYSRQGQSFTNTGGRSTLLACTFTCAHYVMWL